MQNSSPPKTKKPSSDTKSFWIHTFSPSNQAVEVQKEEKGDKSQTTSNFEIPAVSQIPSKKPDLLQKPPSKAQQIRFIHQTCVPAIFLQFSSLIRINFYLFRPAITGQHRAISSPLNYETRKQNSPKVTTPIEKKTRKHSRTMGRSCTTCGTTKTPEWRTGPNREISLCNACGLNYRKNKKKEMKLEATNSTDKISVDNLLNEASPE